MSEWDKFMVPPELLESSGPGSEGAPADPQAADADESAMPGLMVTLEALFDVKDIAQLDTGELCQLKSALARADRETSIASWPLAEPATVTEWRQGVIRRAPGNDVAAAILHALEPYHALVRKADSTLSTVVLCLPAGRVTGIRKGAVMTAWFSQVEQIAARDYAERAAWLRYWVTVSSRMGTQEDTIAWQRGVKRRAETGSEVAARVIESIRQRDQAVRALDRLAARQESLEVHVPGVRAESPPDAPANP